MKTMLLTFVPLLLLSQPYAAQAQTQQPSSRPVAVNAAGLDLATTDGAAAMLERVRDAAERGCKEDSRWDRYSTDFRRCRTETIAAVVAKLDAPLVTALHRDGGQPDAEQMIAAVKR